MIDLSKLGGSPEGGSSPTPGVSAGPSPLPSLPTFETPEAPPPKFDDEAPWDALGRQLWGTAEEGGTLGQIPLIGDLARFPGEVGRNVVGAGSFGLGQVFGGAAEVLSRLPTGALTGGQTPGDPYRLGNATGSKVNAFDPKYPPTPDGGFALLKDLKTEFADGDLAQQFMVLGQWQKKNDPEAFKAWEEALAAAQAGTNIGSKAGEVLNSYIREWGVTYANLTSEGVTGWFDVAPELAFGTSGSAGQSLHDALKTIMTAQQQAEVGAAGMSGNQSGLLGALGGHRYDDNYVDMGSRLNELLHLSDSDPDKMTDVEAAAVYGMKELGWTARHAYGFLTSRGQGYSSDGVTQVALSIALDPTFVAGLGAGQAANVGARAALGYANSAVATSRVQSVYTGIARSIGTTVAEVRTGPMGPAFKVARTVVDPFSAFGKGPEGVAKADVFAAAGIEGTRRGFGPAAVSNAMARARTWGVSDVVNNAYGVSAMNFARKWVAREHVSNLTKFTEPGARRVLTEDMIQTAGKNAPKDAATRLSDFVYKNREFYLTNSGVEQLTERIVKMTGRSPEEVGAAVKAMSTDEQALWHSMSYSNAWTDFVTAMRAAPIEEWGALGPKLDDLVILNPHELDTLSARAIMDNVVTLKSATKGGKAKATKAAIKEWNAAADRYPLIEGIGRVTTGGAAQLERRLNALDRIINEGALHGALDITEMKAMPKSFTDSFLGKWTGLDGQPIWRFGFKPKAQQATGLVYDDAGKLVQRYDPAIENVADAIPMATGVMRGVTDPLGRLIPGAVKGSRLGGAARATYDSLDVALRTASDMVTGERVMASMEQSFIKQMRAEGYSARVAKDVFKQSRTYAQDRGFTLAGMSPEEFWRANKEVLGDLVDARVAKRTLFTMLAKAAGGDMRTLGLASGSTQRIRAGLIARGLDPNNYLGAVTVKLYNVARYTLNPMFFLQAEFDAPWFNMYRGVMFDLRGGSPKPGSPVYEMQGITEAMSKTSMSRDLAMDFTERIATIGWQREVVDQLQKLNFEQGVGQRIKNRLGRLIINNELAYLNSRVGDVVLDAVDTTRKALDDRAAAAANPEEAAMWANQKIDVERVFESITDELTETLGRKPTRDEIGRRYLSEMIEDSHLEVRTQDKLLDYQKVAQKGAYHVPTNIGELRPLNLDYGVESLALPNVHSAADLKTAIREGVYTTGDIRDMMGQMGYHKDHIQRFMNGITFNWRHHFDDLRQALGMSKFEMQGIEDLVAREAKALGMEPVDYITQVLPMTAKKTKKSKGPQYASEGRVVEPGEMETLQSRGRTLMATTASKTPVDLKTNIATVADELHSRTALKEWGGATYSPRTGKFIEDSNEWMYHGTSGRFSESIGKSGITRGDWVNDPASKAIPGKGVYGDNAVIYRTKSFRMKGGNTKADGWNSGGRAAPEDLQISKDGGKTWDDVVAGSKVDDGPWVSGTGKTTRISIKDAQDPVKFKAALDEFVEKNADELQKPGMYVGTFRDDKLGKVEFDVARATFSAGDTEAVQAYLGRKGGAYNVATGDGLFAPQLGPNDMGLGPHMKTVLDVMRAAEKGQAGLDDMTKVVAGNLQPSMKQTLLDHFIERITGPNGLIEKAMAAGDTKAAQDLNLILEDLKGGWGEVADREFRDLVIRRAGGEVTQTGEQLPQPWKDKAINPYVENTELVKVSDLKPFREIDREVTPKFKGDHAHLDELTEQIRREGFKEPVILDYDPDNGLALLGEGNHRLAVAERLGLDNIPMRVVRTKLDNEPRAVSVSGGTTPKSFPRRVDPVGDMVNGGHTPLSDEFIAATPPDPDFAYHATPISNAHHIRKNGLEPRQPVDGAGAADEPGVYFGSNGNELDGLIPNRNKGDVAVYRVRKDRLELSGQYDPAAYGPSFDDDVAAGFTGEYISRKPIPAADIEVLGADGTWGPLVDESKALIGKPKVTPNEHGYFPGDTSPSAVGFAPAARAIAEPEVERAARYFSKYVQEMNPNIGAGEVLKEMVDAIPVEGASPHNFTQGLLMNVLGENFRIAEKDAIRLAHMQTERSVLERSINHPFFALYPSSYFWGKVIPETFRFIAYEPFGMRTTLGLEAYLHVKQSIDMQSMYDDRMKDLWDKVGKSAVMGLVSYLSPSMPWEDMSSNLPPWVRGLSAGDDFAGLLEREFNTFSPERWLRHFVEAGEEVVDGAGGAVESITGPEAEGLNQISTGAFGSVNTGGAQLAEGTSIAGFSGTVQGMSLGPILEGSLADLQTALTDE